MCEQITGDKQSFMRIQANLDYYGTAQVAGYECAMGKIKTADGKKATGVDETVQQTAKKCLLKAADEINAMAHKRKELLNDRML
jgi:formate-dependent nitrite reductase cytochrome c552 subunit